jgi:hypothetical protein
MYVCWVVVVRCKSAGALGDRRGLCGSSLMRVTSKHDIKSRQTYVCLRMTSCDARRFTRGGLFGLVA